jgi:hypothetical protein
MRTAFRKFYWGFVALAILWPGRASATTIDPLLIEQLVLGADFVGVVECDRAGGIVAGCKVIESWKGPKAGERVTIRVAVNYWEPQFPIALCGERYFVTAYKQTPSTIVSTTSGGGVPLWWRDVPADYRLPLFQGLELLTAEEEKAAEFQATKKKVRELLALKPAEQEAVLLKAVIEKDLFGTKWKGGEPDAEKANGLRARFEKVADADGLVSELLRLVGDDAKKWSVRVRIVLEKAGGAATLARLDKIAADKSPWEKGELADLIKGIKERQGGEAPHKSAPPREGRVPRRRHTREVACGARRWTEA